MRTTNPALNDRIFEREAAAASQSGWAAPATAPTAPHEAPPRVIHDGAMTIGGVVSASTILIAIVLATGWLGWYATDTSATSVRLPGWLLPAALGAFAVALVTIFVPRLARFTAPIYAAAEGFLLGAISHLYEAQFEGIVLQAVGLTVGVFCVLLFLYATRVIKVTDNLRMGIVAATGAVAIVYVVSLVVRLFGAEVPFIHDAGPIGILFSLAVVVIASLNLVLDFDFIERGAALGAPKHMEWYAAFGLLVTLVWLYLELLRLLSKLRER